MDPAQIKQLQQENQRLRIEVKLLRQKLDALARQMFGRKSEQLNPAQLELLFKELEDDALGQPPASVPAQEPEATSRRRSTPRKPRLPDDLPVDIETIDPDPVSANPHAYRQIGEEVSDQIDYTPGQFRLKRTVRRTWVKRADPDAAPMTATLAPKLLDRGILAPGLLAHILVSKYADHLPLYRQETIFKQRHGVHLPRQTLARGVALAADWLELIVKHMAAEQIAGGYCQIDETMIRFQQPGTGRAGRGYLWATHVPGGDTVFRWGPGRGHELLLEWFPEAFAGTLQCDGYAAYPAFQKKRTEVKLAACWAHARRGFHEAHEQKEDPEQSAWFLRQISHLYRIETQLRNSRAGPKLRQAVRAAEAVPILRRLERRLRKLVVTQRFLPQSRMGKAIAYTLGQWNGLMVYTENGRLEIDNNLVENAIRPTAIGKKNWLFFGPGDSGKASAIIYSLIVSCRSHGVEPFAYLKDVLERIPALKASDVDQLTPRAWQRAQAQNLQIAS